MSWNVDPILLKFGVFEIRYYGLLFAVGFLAGYLAFQRMFRIEGKRVEDLDLGLYLVIAGTIIGARLGHCLFYEPEIYLREPLRILKVWEGGLASHGGAIGILLALVIYCKQRPDQPFLYITDRLSYCVAFAGGLIRIGNFFNSEMIGRPTDLPWGITFERIDQLSRHPSMLYESFFYLITAFVLFRLYERYKAKTPRGLLTGLFFIMVFTARFFIEFTKEDQVAFEAGMTLNMGQWLSVPFVIAGILLVKRSLKAPLPNQSEGQLKVAPAKKKGKNKKPKKK